MVFDIANPMAAQPWVEENDATTSNGLENLSFGFDQRWDDDEDEPIDQYENKEDSFSHPMPQYIKDLHQKLPKRFYAKDKSKQPQFAGNRRQTPYSSDEAGACKRHYQRILIRLFHMFDWICRVHPEFGYILIVDKPHHINSTFGTKESYAKNSHVVDLQKLLQNDRKDRSSLHDQRTKLLTANLPESYSARFHGLVLLPTIGNCINLISKLNRKVLRAVSVRWREFYSGEIPADPNRKSCDELIAEVLKKKAISTKCLWDSLIGISKQNSAVGVKEVVQLMQVLDLRLASEYEDSGADCHQLPIIGLDGETTCDMKESYLTSSVAELTLSHSNSVSADTITKEAVNVNTTATLPGLTTANFTLKTANRTPQSTFNSNPSATLPDLTTSELLITQGSLNLNPTATGPELTNSNSSFQSSDAITQIANSNAPVPLLTSANISLDFDALTPEDSLNANPTETEPKSNTADSIFGSDHLFSQGSLDAIPTTTLSDHTNAQSNLHSDDFPQIPINSNPTTTNQTDLITCISANFVEGIPISTPPSHEAYPLIRKLLHTGSQINLLQSSLPRIPQESEPRIINKLPRSLRKRRAKSTTATNKNFHETKQVTEARYEVESILNEHIKDGKTFYKVKWSEGSVTVEPAENIQADCPMLVKEFNERLEFDKDHSDKRMMIQMRRNGSHRSKRRRNAMLINK
ncbi:hypothetical protein BC833DRAFT_661553 [Globomyces pollinis-pini]|nr:hypothetical protein BC833DRAFT_661553 [Globomyces pollinis-pini]